jgi:DNA-directed RNA polymerase specialized sigma24 family protein
VTLWLGRIKAGDQEAVQRLWERYFAQLVRLARARLPSGRRRVADEEDVALSALASFCRRAAEGRFPNLHDRNGLWPLLVAIAARKAGKVVRKERRHKRGGGAVRGESALVPAGDHEGHGADWNEVLGREPTPDFACQVAEECRRLLSRLDRPELQQLALWKMDGFTNAEIAARLGCVSTTVERRLRLIRRLWEKE